MNFTQKKKMVNFHKIAGSGKKTNINFFVLRAKGMTLSQPVNRDLFALVSL